MTNFGFKLSLVHNISQIVMWALLFWQLLPADRSKLSPNSWVHIYEWDMTHYWKDNSWFKTNLHFA